LHRFILFQPIHDSRHVTLRVYVYDAICATITPRVPFEICRDLLPHPRHLSWSTAVRLQLPQSQEIAMWPKRLRLKGPEHARPNIAISRFQDCQSQSSSWCSQNQLSSRFLRRNRLLCNPAHYFALPPPVECLILLKSRAIRHDSFQTCRGIPLSFLSSCRCQIRLVSMRANT
jgi:hypothetical protein